MMESGWDLVALGVSVPLAGLCAVAVFNLLTAARLESARPAASADPGIQRTPLVGGTSVLVPARDEAANLRVLLPLLSAQGPGLREVLVLDDGSSDETDDVVRRAAELDSRVRLIAGASLPAGWLGKPWACVQLAWEARGAVLVFCDADVRPAPEAVAATGAALDLHGADVLTALPRHEGGGPLVRATLAAALHLPVAGLLPLRAVGARPEASLALGNGQWLAFRREAYTESGGHGGVRDRVVEDMELARAAKRAGLRVVAVTAVELLAVRMYGDVASLRAGLAKNLFPLLGGSFAGLVAAFTAGGLLILPLAAPLWTSWGWLPVGLIVLFRLASARLFRHDPATLMLHPLGVAAALALAAGSAWHTRRGTAVWKGRTVVVGAANAASRKGDSR
jgi:cellulose synthase/poly-beta-1,6-N-acetylglucosamine synthase-like glycosyltransferase